MSFALTSFRKDLARWRKDFVSILLWVSIPLIVGSLVTLMMAQGGAQPHGVLLLVDEDESFLSGLVVSAYSAGDLGELISVEETNYDDGIQRVNDGEASGLLVIPEGFSNAFVNSEPVTLTLRTNPSQFILPGIITDVTEILLDAGFYAHQLFGDEINTLTGLEEDPDEAFVAAMAVQIQNKMEALVPKLLPPIIDVEIVESPPAEPRPPLALLFLPGVVLMGVMFSSSGIAGDYWTEREQGTLRRLVFTPGRLGGFVAGKALAAGVVIGAVGGFTLLVGFLYHGISWLKLPSSVAWIAVSGIALFAWFSALQMLFSSKKVAEVISTVIVFPLLMAGGSFFPLAVMPDWIGAIGRLSPNGFVVTRLTSEITSAGAWVIDLNSWFGVTAAGIVGLAICAWRLNTGFAKS